uniref:transposase n=1 Tax=Okeania sp. SIO2F4 TaxID=2607790 RepID=UPI0025E7C900|nr:transposase [Okeania sp. SIO2F4]
MRVDINNLVFVDYSGVNDRMTRLYGRGKVGERVVSNAPRNKGKNTSVLGVLSLDGLIVSMKVIGSTNKNVFEILDISGKQINCDRVIKNLIFSG